MAFKEVSVFRRGIGSFLDSPVEGGPGMQVDGALPRLGFEQKLGG